MEEIKARIPKFKTKAVSTKFSFKKTKYGKKRSTDLLRGSESEIDMA